MYYLELTINKFLLVENFKFKNLDNDLDYLNKKAILENDLEKKLAIFKIATYKIEKFHSFFHFEQSYFHLQLALALLETGKKNEADKELELAIFQDHCNEQAIELQKEGKSNKIYNRLIGSFQDYLNSFFEETLGENSIINYWSDFENYLINKDINLLKEIILKIRKLHLGYHQEAAKLYLNRAVTFTLLKEKELAKNDLRKANYLDFKIRECEFYLPIEKFIIS